MATTENIKIVITTEAGGAERAIKNLNGTLDAQEKQVGRLSGAVGKFKQNWVGIVGALGGVTLAFSKSIKAASDLEETTNKFDVTFRGVAESAQASSKMLADSYGLSTRESKALLSATGDLLTGFGMSQGEVLNLSTDLNKLAVDLASFTNIEGGAERASKALTSGLLGERESMKSLGIVIREEDLKARLAAQGKDKLTGSALMQAKAEETLKMAMEQSKNAMGDFERSRGSFANQTRILNAGIEDMTAAFGQALLPVITPIIGVFSRMAGAFNNMNPTAKKIISTMGVLAVAIGAVAVAIKMLGFSFQQALIASGIGAIVVAIAAGAYLLYENWEQVSLAVMKFAQIMYGFVIGAINTVTGGINKLITGFNNLTGAHIPLIAEMDKVNQTLDRSIAKAQADLDAKKKANAQKVTDQQSHNNQMNVMQTEQTAVEVQAEKDKNLTIEEVYAQHMTTMQEFTDQSWSQMANTIAGYGQKFAGTINRIYAQMYKNRGIELENDYNREKKRIQNSTLSEEQKAKKIQELDEKTDKKRRKLVREQAKQQKNAAIFSIGVDTSSAIVSALADLPYPANVVAAIAIGALGTAEMAAVKAEPLPEAATGALIKGSIGGTPILAGEAGKSEMIIPFENEEVQQRLGGGRGGGSVVVNIENLYGDDTMPTKVAEAIDQALLRLKRNNMSAFAEAL